MLTSKSGGSSIAESSLVEVTYFGVGASAGKINCVKFKLQSSSCLAVRQSIFLDRRASAICVFARYNTVTALYSWSEFLLEYCEMERGRVSRNSCSRQMLRLRSVRAGPVPRRVAISISELTPNPDTIPCSAISRHATSWTWSESLQVQ